MKKVSFLVLFVVLVFVGCVSAVKADDRTVAQGKFYEARRDVLTAIAASNLDEVNRAKSRKYAAELDYLKILQRDNPGGDGLDCTDMKKRLDRAEANNDMKNVDKFRREYENNCLQ